MAIRSNTGSKNNFGVHPLPSGLEKENEKPELTIPSCGVEDVDLALFNLFEKQINCQFKSSNESSALKKVPVIFAAGEKWALLKKNKPLRDKNNSLIIPLITIIRTEWNQTLSDLVSRGINQQTGEIVIKRRLDKSDRDYQNLLNKLLIPNQKNVANSHENGLKTNRKTGELTKRKMTKDGAYLSPHRLNNIYETIVAPSPQFFTAKYQITVWTQYVQHSNEIIEQIISSMLPQAQSWKIETNKGYWFVAKLEDGSMSIENNFDDMSQQERFIKNTFEITVPAYIFASAGPGKDIPLKRYISSPIISFETAGDSGGNEEPELSTSENLYILGSDDPTLPLDLQENKKKDQLPSGWRLQKIYPVLNDINDDEGTVDTADKSLNEDVPNQTLRGGSIKVIGKNSLGETVYSGAALDDLKIRIK